MEYCVKDSCAHSRAENSMWCTEHHCIAGTCKLGPGPLCHKHRTIHITIRQKDLQHHCVVLQCYNPGVIGSRSPLHCKIHWCMPCSLPTYVCTHHYVVDPDLDGWITTCDKPGCPNPRHPASIGCAYMNSCSTCLTLCDVLHCNNPHLKGTALCKVHTCRCYGGDYTNSSCTHNPAVITYAQNFYRCQNLHCKTCPVTNRYLAVYLIAGLACDMPVVEALLHTLTRTTL